MFRDVAAGVRNIFGARSKAYENEPGSAVRDALAELEPAGGRRWIRRWL